MSGIWTCRVDADEQMTRLLKVQTRIIFYLPNWKLEYLILPILSYLFENCLLFAELEVRIFNFTNMSYLFPDGAALANRLSQLNTVIRGTKPHFLNQSTLL